MNSAKVTSTLIEVSEQASAGASAQTGSLTWSWHVALAALHRCGPPFLLGLVTSLLGWSFAHVFAGEPAGSDNSFHYGELARLAAAIRAGDWNWWNPGGNSGFASGYYYQVLPQALPALLSALTGLSPLFCFQLGIFVPLTLVPMAAYRAVRIAGGTSWQALGAAIAVPCAVGSSRWGHGADGAFTVGLYTQTWALAAFPLALAHATRWLEGRRGFAAALAWGLFVGLCHPFAGVALGLALFAGVACSAIRRRLLSAELSRLVSLGGILLLGAACVWLPALVDYEGFGGFPYRPADEVGPGFVELARWFVEGQILDEGRGMRLMTALLPLVLYCARAPWLPRLWAAGFAFAFLLGAGPCLPKIGDDIFPPVRFTGPLQIVLAMCAGIGVAALVEQVWRKTEGRRDRGTEGRRDGGTERPRDGETERSSLCPSVPPSLCLSVSPSLCPSVPPSLRPSVSLSLRLLRAARFAVLAAAVIVALMVATSGRRILSGRVKVATDMPAVARDQLGDVMDAMKTAPPGRFQVYGAAAHHWSMMLPYVETGRPACAIMGGGALQSSPNFAYHRNLEDPARAAWVFDAPVTIARPGELHIGQALKTTNAYELRVFPSPGLVGPVQVTGELPAGRNAARAAGLRWLSSDLPLQNKVLAHHGWGGAGLPPRGRALWMTRGDSTIRAEVEAEAATTFIVRESWHPRWRATLDGAQATIRRVTPDYMAIDAPEGKHKLELRFERPLWTWMLWLLWPALPVAAWAFERRRMKWEAFA